MPVSPQISVEELVCLESFQHYCLGIGIAEQLFWEQWLQENPSRAGDVEEAKKLFQIVSARQGNRLEQLKQLRAGIQQSESFRQLIAPPADRTIVPPADITSGGPGQTSPFTSWYTYAAGLAATLLVAVLGYVFLFKSNPTPIAQQVQTTKHQTVSSGGSLRKTVVLADGSVVTLRENSTLAFQNSFNKSNREVWLTGEGFFDISHDQAHPFIVHALFTDIKVLGTIFNVQAQHNATSTEVSLLKGKVEVTSQEFPGEPVILKPNQKLISSLKKSGATDQASSPYFIVDLSPDANTHIPKETAWVRTRLVIDNEPLGQISQQLEKLYGIQITFTDPEVRKYRYSGVFENENVVRSLEALQLSYPFTFTVEQDKIIISK